MCLLLARGLSGPLTIVDGRSGKPRLVIRDIEKAAKLTVEEGPNGPRFVKLRQSRVDRAPAGESQSPDPEEAPNASADT